MSAVRKAHCVWFHALLKSLHLLGQRIQRAAASPAENVNTVEVKGSSVGFM